jgi:hypothetical protein
MMISYTIRDIFRKKNILKTINNIVVYSRFHRLRREFNRKKCGRVYHVRKFENKMSRIKYNDFIHYQNHSVVRYWRRPNSAQVSITMRSSHLRTPVIKYTHNLTLP